MAIINSPRTVGEAIDTFIQSMKQSGGIRNSAYKYSEFLNLKKDLLELKTLMGHATVNKDSLEAVKKEYFSSYSTTAPRLERRKYILHLLLDFIDTIK